MNDTEIAQADTSPLHMGFELVRCESTKVADAHAPVIEASHSVDRPKEALGNRAEVCFCFSRRLL